MTYHISQLDVALKNAAIKAQRAMKDATEQEADKIYEELKSDMGKSSFNKSIVRSFNDYVGAEGAGSISIEVGAQREKHRAAGLANVAYVGTSRGGGTVRNPALVLKAREDAMRKAIADAAKTAMGDI